MTRIAARRAMCAVRWWPEFAILAAETFQQVSDRTGIPLELLMVIPRGDPTCFVPNSPDSVLEPERGIEPRTYALRVRRSAD
jgi:hypothetical protein